MIVATLLALQHGDSPHLDLVYFWAAVLLAATPVAILGTIGALVVRGVVQARRAARTGPPALPGPAPGPALDGPTPR